MRRPIPHILASLLSLVICQPAFVQEIEDIEGEIPEIRRYTVEVIVFKYAEEVSTGSEIFLPDEIAEEEVLEELAFEEDIEILEEPDAEFAAGEEEPEPLPDTEFVLLVEDDYQLGEVMEHLTRIDAYEPVMHFGWTQATWPQEETEAIPLHRFAEPPEGFDGSLTLYLSRYLHLVVDLQLDAKPPAEVVGQDDFDYRYDASTSGEFLGYGEDQEPTLPVRYSIQENRILRSGELRYYDHPKFGVLAMVNRIEEEEESLDDTGELLGYGPE